MFWIYLNAEYYKLLLCYNYIEKLPMLYLQADLTGTMANGNGKILHVGTVSLVLDVTNLHHPQCLLVPHPMHD